MAFKKFCWGLCLILSAFTFSYAQTYPDPEVNKLQVDTTSTFAGDVTISSPSVLKGDRFVINSCGSGDPGSGGTFDFTEVVQMSTSRGYPLPRAGSIVGVSAQCDVTSVTTAGTLRVEVFVDTDNDGTATSALTCDSNSVSTVSVPTWGCTLARDNSASSKFIAPSGNNGPFISVSHKEQTFVGSTLNCTATVEVILDN